MSSYQAQKGIVTAIEKVVDSKLYGLSTTNSLIGIVIEEPRGFDCKVSIRGQEFECTLPEHLHTWIQKDDVVIVQDLYGDGRSKIITGKTGTVHKQPSIVFFDKEKEKNISGRDGLFDESGNRVDALITVEGHE